MSTGEDEHSSPWGPAVRPSPVPKPAFWTPGAIIGAAFTAGILIVVTAFVIAVLRPHDTDYERIAPIPTYVQPPVDTQPDAPVGARPGSIAGFAAPRASEVSAVFTLEQAIAASQLLVDQTVQAAGTITDPAIAPHTTTFPVAAGGCDNIPGGRVTFEVWFEVADADLAIERVRAVWEANGLTLDPTSSAGRYGYTGAATNPIDLASIENKSGTIKLRVQSVCTPGVDY